MTASLLNLDFASVNNASLHRTPVIGVNSKPPSTGQWLAGDILYNSAVAVGSPTGWICTTSGCPGLWTTLPEVVS